MKSRLLKVGGSSWRPNIDPRGPQEKKNNDFEEDRTRRGENKDIKYVKKRQSELPTCLYDHLVALNMLWHRLTRQRGVCDEKEG